MTDSTTTSFENKCDILGELWVEHKHDVEFEDFIDYNDLGLPLAYALATEIVTHTPKAELFIDETFDLLLTGLGITDEGFETLADVMIRGGTTE